jgi:hypothetical protein
MTGQFLLVERVQQMHISGVECLGQKGIESKGRGPLECESDADECYIDFAKNQLNGFSGEIV